MHPDEEAKYSTFAADLTLRVVRAVQGPPRGAVVQWFIVPDLEEVGWSGLTRMLAALPKPVVIAPLLQPGMIGVWTIGSLTESQRHIVRRLTKNRVDYFREKLDLLSDAPVQTIEFRPEDENKLRMTRTDFERWIRDFSVSVGITVVSTGDPTMARLIVLLPGSGSSPTGFE
jgi:hypothetical protein